jgi:hypothetical protein
LRTAQEANYKAAYDTGNHTGKQRSTGSQRYTQTQGHRNEENNKSG